MRKPVLRNVLGACFTVGLLVAIAALLGLWERSTLRPTPVPEWYQPVQVNEVLPVAPLLKGTGERPVFLHFFNLNCPCSRFNMAHFSTLAEAYAKEVDFYVVLPATDDSTRMRTRFYEKYDLALPVLIDHNNKLAKQCGVYATPQAVLLNADFSVYYKGNYNQARFCTLPGSSFAAIALQRLVTGQAPPTFGMLANQTYGCSLPEYGAATSWLGFDKLW